MVFSQERIKIVRNDQYDINGLVSLFDKEVKAKQAILQRLKVRPEELEKLRQAQEKFEKHLDVFLAAVDDDVVERHWNALEKIHTFVTNLNTKTRRQDRDEREARGIKESVADRRINAIVREFDKLVSDKRVALERIGTRDAELEQVLQAERKFKDAVKKFEASTSEKDKTAAYERLTKLKEFVASLKAQTRREARDEQQRPPRSFKDHINQ